MDCLHDTSLKCMQIIEYNYFDNDKKSTFHINTLFLITVMIQFTICKHRLTTACFNSGMLNMVGDNFRE